MTALLQTSLQSYLEEIGRLTTEARKECLLPQSFWFQVGSCIFYSVYIQQIYVSSQLALIGVNV